MRKRLLITLGIVILTLGVLCFSTRNFFLRKVIEKVVDQITVTYHLNITYSEVGFAGIKTSYIRGLRVYSDTGDTIVKSDSILLNPKLLPLLVGRKRLKELELYNTSIRLNSNFIRQLKSQLRDTSKDSVAIQAPANYTCLLNSLQDKLFTLIPEWIVFRNFGFTFQHDGLHSSVFCENFNYHHDRFLGDIVIRENHYQGRCLLEGLLNPGSRQLEASVSHTDTSLVRLPFINDIWQAFLGFDTLRFTVHSKKINATLSRLTGDAFVKNFVVQHKSIAPNPVITRTGSIHYTINIGDRYAELDSSSVINMNGFTFSPWLRFENQQSHRITLAIIQKEFEAQQFFESLPTGLFTNFEGIQTNGRLAYHLKVTLDFDHPDSVLFDSKLENKDFTVKKYGVTDFRMINGSFTHHIYDKDRYVGAMEFTPENPDLVALDDISPYLKYSILTAEDGDFFYHRGFNQNAFRESIATNLKEHRFARGGSTISMQLVKNIFLRGDKTISRKVEEALIVWTIENLRLISKERMFEVYLNIIEMGPGVYGIKKASKFYFNKLPGALNLNESIFLSSIIPRPKSFRYTFVHNGVLRDYLASYYKLLGDIMIRRNQISPADTMNLKPHVMLTGEAQYLLNKQDTIISADSLDYKDLFPEETLIQK